VDIDALLQKEVEYQTFLLKDTVVELKRICKGGRLVCVVGKFREINSTLAATMVKMIPIDAYHFCSQADKTGGCHPQHLAPSSSDG
jgi:hypothetical protein